MPARLYTAADLESFPTDGNRYEILAGELLVSPSPRGLHQIVLARLARILAAHAGDYADEVMIAPSDVFFAEDTVLAPDIYVADLTAFWQSNDWRDVRTMHLVVEITSPSTAARDWGIKRRRYLAEGVPVYWVVDLEAKQVEVWTPDAQMPVVEREQLVWKHPAVEGVCTVPLAELFSFPRADGSRR